MRFGKKLALQQQKDASEAPYLSHKLMKEAINRTVRELRIYHAKLQDMEHNRVGNSGSMQTLAHAAGSSGSSSQGCGVTMAAAELQELEERVSTLDKQLFVQIDDDLAKLLQHVRLGESRISRIVAGIQSDLVDIGLLTEETKLRQLQKKMPGVIAVLGICRQMVDLQVQCDPVGMGERLRGVTIKFNSVADVVNEHAQYLEINVAGFRKLLKRHEKQIPAKFRARPMPFLGFHRLVTHTSHHLLETCQQVAHVITDAWQRLASAAQPGVVAQQPDIVDVKGLGPECEMVLKVQKQLKGEVNNQLSFDAPGMANQPLGYLYPKPEVPSQHTPETQNQNQQLQQPQQQPQQQQQQQQVLLQPQTAQHYQVFGAAQFNWRGALVG